MQRASIDLLTAITASSVTERSKVLPPSYVLKTRGSCTSCPIRGRSLIDSTVTRILRSFLSTGAVPSFPMAPLSVT
eukprot:66458-Rhodomonas_salina.2